MPANPLEYNKKGPHSFEWGLLVAEGGFEPPTSGYRFAPLAVPEKIFELFARSIFSTAAQTPS